MDSTVVIVLAALAAAVVAAVGPLAIAGLPEPAEPEPDKLLYPQVAVLPGIRAWLVVPAAAGAALVAWRIETPELIPVWVVVCGAGSWLAFVDWHTRYLPFALVAMLYLAVLALTVLGAALAGDWNLLLHAVYGNIALYLIFRVMHWLADRFFGGAFGYGDVRLSAALGLALGALGYDATLVGGYGGFVLGALFGVVLSRLGIIDRNGFAFGPYMVLAAVLGAAFGGVLSTS